MASSSSKNTCQAAIEGSAVADRTNFRLIEALDGIQTAYNYGWRLENHWLLFRYRNWAWAARAASAYAPKASGCSTVLCDLEGPPGSHFHPFGNL